jgi:hypothetical protein
MTSAGIALFATLDPERQRLVMELIHGFSQANRKAYQAAIAALPKGPDYKNWVYVPAPEDIFPPSLRAEVHGSPQRN